MFETHLALTIALVSLVATGITVVTFFMRLKWDSEQHDIKLKECKEDIDAIGIKLNAMQQTSDSEARVMLAKIDSIDKAVVCQGVALKYIEETVREIKEAIK